MDVGEKYIFEAEWYDKVACVLKKFYLHYYPVDNSIELFDIKTKKTFLRRSRCEGIESKDIHVGAMVSVFSRNMRITNYADESTKEKLSSKLQKTLALIKPDAIDKMGEIIKRIISLDFHITNLKMVALSREDAKELYRGKDGSELAKHIDYLTSGPIVALEILGKNGITRWKEILGPSDCMQAREKAQTSLRAQYGKDAIRNSLHGSDSLEDALKELQFFFPDAKHKKKGLKNTATLKNCTCCIIKPHAVQSQLIGNIIDDIQKAGYRVSAMQQFYVDSVNAEEFLEVYKGVLPEYGAMVGELQSGPCIVMEITHKDADFDVQTEFRKLCGPMDPDMAKQVRPNTLRAKYGKSRVQNAIHCSDLPEDGLLEVEYFFKILADN